MLKFFNRLLLLQFLLNLSMTVHALPGIDIVSSVLWNKSDKKVYFPGLKAVYHEDGEDQEFRVEFYTSRSLSSDQVSLRVKGPFLSSVPYFKVRSSECDETVVGTGLNGEEGYQCYVDFVVRSGVPSGLASFQIEISESAGVIRHPNLFYVMIFPERQSVSEPETVEEAKVISTGQPSFDFQEASSVIQLSLPGNMSLGTGFFVKNVEELEGYLRGFSAEAGGRYVVSAAHVFPMELPDRAIGSGNQLLTSE